MHLSCPECSTTFEIPADILGQGKKVRCSNCSHVWLATAEANPAEPHIKALKVPAGGNSAVNKNVDDAEDKTSKFLSAKYLKIAASVLILMNFVAFIWFNKSVVGQAAFYDVIGQYDTKAWEIDSHIANASPFNKSGSMVEVAWNLKNTSTKAMQLPEVRFQLFDDKAEFIGKKYTPGKSNKIPGGEEVKFKDKLTHESKAARYLTIEVGNPAELATR